MKPAAPNTEAWPNIFAKKGFPIAGELSRPDKFPGTIVYYFEVTIISSYKRFIFIGLSNGNIPWKYFVGQLPNSYAIREGFDYCFLSGNKQQFEYPNGLIKPEWNGQGDVLGSGLVLNPENELSVFFTQNGILMGKPIPIKSRVDTFYPTVSMVGNFSVEANFGDDLARPFSYDIKKCTEMNLE